MAEEPKVRFFLGANTPGGFYSLYDQMLDPARAADIFILKGGPGCGKSSLMRKVGRAMEERGVSVEYIECSGDPDSLDAVIFPTLAVALVDGTAPHAGVQKSTRKMEKGWGNTASLRLRRFAMMRCCPRYEGIFYSLKGFQIILIALCIYGQAIPYGNRGCVTQGSKESL